MFGHGIGESVAGKWEKEMLVIWLENVLRFDQQTGNRIINMWHNFLLFVSVVN